MGRDRKHTFTMNLENKPGEQSPRLSPVIYPLGVSVPLSVKSG